jgi:hypothetical protein
LNLCVALCRIDAASCCYRYYAQRVIGNYYIRKAQDYQKRGIHYVDLHAS